MTRRFGAVAATLLVAGCATQPRPAPQPAPPVTIPAPTPAPVAPPANAVTVGITAGPALTPAQIAPEAAARALADTGMDAEAVVRRSLQIAAEICVYTNANVVVESLEG